MKTKIIDMAFKVWGRNFYQKTSLSQLAKELGVSKPALYRHFVNKQALTTAMTERFYDDFAASIQADMERALEAKDPDEGIFIIIQSIAGYFARNVYALIFSLINIYDRNLDGVPISDIGMLRLVVEKKYYSNPAILQLIFATLTFYMSHFHFHEIYKSGCLENLEDFEISHTEEEIKNVISSIHKIVERGLGLTAEKAGVLDFQKLETMVEGTLQSIEPEPLFKAVAEAVAEAGPWNASMDMVAKRIGLSKSSLYGHFLDRKDMLRRLFLTEFTRIIEFARQGISLSSDPVEQLYLGIYSIAIYLRSRPEILISMGWIRTRKLDLGKPEKQTEVFRLFEDVSIGPLLNAGDEEKQRISHWVLFLLINILTRPYMSENGWQTGFSTNNVQNTDIQMLYKFITLGLGGFLNPLNANEKK